MSQIRNIVNKQRGDRFNQYDAIGQSKIDNAIYQGLLTGSEVTTHQLQQDRSLERGIQSQQARRQQQLFDYQWDTDANGNITGYSEPYEIQLNRANGMFPEYDGEGNVQRDAQGKIIYRKLLPTDDSGSSSGSGGRSSTQRIPMLASRVRIKYHSRRGKEGKMGKPSIDNSGHTHKHY